MPAPTAQIAIVDDDASVRKALTRLLRASSYRVETFGSAGDFLTSLNQRIPDCLIADLQMPSMDGLELRISLSRAGIAIPTIIITAYDELGSRQQCSRAGAAAYLLKPVQKTELIAAIKATTEGQMCASTKVDGDPTLIGEVAA
jgi:FixJ family two-component response regulator